MPARRRDPVSVPRTFHSSSRPYHHSHDYGIDESISRAGYFSNAVLDDTDAAAAYSRAKDYDLIRNTNSAIRQPTTDYGSSRASRSVSRYPSLPPVDRKLPLSRSSLSPTPSRSAIVPHKSLTDLRSALQSPPPPTSLLSSRINSYLRGDSLPLGVRPSTRSLVSYKSYLDSAAPRPPPPSHDSRSIVSYKSHLSDPAVTSPFSTRSSSRLYRGFVPSSSSSLPPYRFRSDSASSSLPRYNISLDDKEDDYDYGGSDGDEDEDEYDPPSYRRKYKILRGRQALPSRPSSTLYYTSGSRAGSDDDDYDDYSLVPEDRGTYSYNPRPLGVPPVTLSSFEGPHDGSYEADMAEMYDYVPFRPSRQGILELTQHRPSPSSIEILDADNDDDDLDSSPSFLPSPSSSTLLTFPPAGASYSSPTIPSTSLYPKSSSDLTSSPYSPVSSYADNNVMFDSVLSNTAARARAALKDNQHLSDYRNASLVMSVEGSAVSPDGKNRYGFRYYPPPIALKGSGVGLDERILGVTPKPNTSPADSFFGDYLNRLKSLRSEINDREGSRAASCSPYSRGVVSVPRPMPSYAHSTVHMPVHIAGRSASVPVSSYRSHADDHGLSHRVDIFPLVESSTSLGKDKVQLPLYRAGGDTSKLTMLEKINIKAATETHSSPRAAVASMRARASSVPPKVQARPVRLQQQLVNRPKVAPSIIFMSTPPVASSNPVRHASTPVAQQIEVPWRIRASSVQPESRARRAGSMPPRPLSHSQAWLEPEPQERFGTEGLRAHRGPVVLRRSRAGSVPPPRPQSYHASEPLPPSRWVRAGSVHSLRPQSYQPVERQAIGTEGLRASRPSALSRMDRAQSMSRVPPRRPLDFGIDEAELEKCLSKYKAKPGDMKQGRGFAPRAGSEPPHFVRPSSAYPVIADTPERFRHRQLFTRRAQVVPSAPSRRVGLPPVYIPSSVAKAAIIGSKMEAEDGGKSKRKPRPLYHVEKSREPSAGSSQQSSIYSDAPVYSWGLQSSRPPLPKTTDRKSIRTVDGFTKPKNVMSWEHRIESRISPDDLIYQPQSMSRLREQLRGARDKADVHRQLIDRYLDTNTDKASAGSSNKKLAGPLQRTQPIYRPAPPAIYVPPARVSFPKLTPLPSVRIHLGPATPFKRATSVDTMESASSTSSSRIYR